MQLPFRRKHQQGRKGKQKGTEKNKEKKIQKRDGNKETETMTNRREVKGVKENGKREKGKKEKTRSETILRINERGEITPEERRRKENL